MATFSSGQGGTGLSIVTWQLHVQSRLNLIMSFRSTMIDQRELREEVKRWLRAMGQRLHGVAARQVSVRRAADES